MQELEEVRKNLEKSQQIIDRARDFLKSRKVSLQSTPSPEKIEQIDPSQHPLKGNIKKVQIGCGPKNILPDWWNVDIRHFPGIDRVMDVTQPWPFTEIEYIYGEHFLEHLTLEGAVNFLRHAWHSSSDRVVLRLSTPALEWVLSTHMHLEEPNPKIRRAQTFAMNRAFHGWGHQFLYSQAVLTELLENLGWTNLRYCQYGASQHPALKNLERHGKYRLDNGYPSVWIVEATKTRIFPDISQYVEGLKTEYINTANAEH
ncbi:MAG: hypothetical protein SWY16_17500 [Cyanobacteriota bacterium]|nr:hypothetical protein [Cyanobacteriota bacterium]